MPLNTLGSNREQLLELAAADRDRLIASDVLVGDPRRWRPRWFDGRFLAASDLQGEQNYFLVRQADLGRAGGTGVIDGLTVSLVRDAASGVERLRIEAGQGVSDTGELVVLFDPLQVSPADVPEMRRLDAAFGLQVIPNEPGHTRTGLYVLVLRPVEWTANPIGAYPTSLAGTRAIEDGTIVEGVAVSLVPYPETSTDDSWSRRRARVAREIFVDGKNRGLTSGVLPLAMVALRGNIVEWVDPFMVRRETGAERPAGMDFGFGARALRESHLLQYQRHLADALNASNDQPFAATAYLDALPPVGQFPAGAIDPDRLVQRFFPPGIEVELSFVPDDELPAVIEESLLMPPIDLTGGLEGLTGTGVIILVPLSRATFNQRRSDLPNWDAELLRVRPAFLEIKAGALPRDLLLSRLFKPVVVTTPAAPEAPWRELLRTAVTGPLLWYVRRRHLPIPVNVAGTPVPAGPTGLRLLMESEEDLAAGIDRLRSIASPEVDALTRRLTEARFVDNPGLLRTIVREAGGSDEAPPTAPSAITVLAAVADPDVGSGLSRLTPGNQTLARTLASDRIVETGALLEIDRLARDVPAERLPELATELRTAVRTGQDVNSNVAALRLRFVPTP